MLSSQVISDFPLIHDFMLKHIGSDELSEKLQSELRYLSLPHLGNYGYWTYNRVADRFTCSNSLASILSVDKTVTLDQFISSFISSESSSHFKNFLLNTLSDSYCCCSVDLIPPNGGKLASSFCGVAHENNCWGKVLISSEDEFVTTLSSTYLKFSEISLISQTKTELIKDSLKLFSSINGVNSVDLFLPPLLDSEWKYFYSSGESSQSNKRFIVESVIPHNFAELKSGHSLTVVSQDSDSSLLLIVPVGEIDATPWVIYSFNFATDSIFGKEIASFSKRIRDIAFNGLQRISIEKSLSDKKTSFRTYIERSPIGLFVLDNDGVILEANNRVLELTGHSENCLKDNAFQSFISKDSIDSYRSFFDRIQNSEKTEGTASFKRRGGGYSNLELYGTRLDKKSLLIYAIDVTTQIKFQNDLRRSEENYRTLFETMQTAFARYSIITDDSGELIDYIYLQINPAFEKISGFSASDIVGKSGSEILGSATIGFITILDKFREVISGTKVVQFECYVERYKRWLSITAYSLKQGECITQFSDVTEKKEMEDRLNHSAKMEALGQLAGGVAHDFNNQLAGIVGFADILRDELASLPELQEYTEYILQTAKRATELTSSLLTFARKKSVELKRVDLHQIVDEVGALLLRSLDKKITFEKRLSASSPFVLGDATQLQNALLNLCINARDAISEKGCGAGELIIESDEIYLNEGSAELLQNGAAGNYVVVRVCDTGCGISEENASRIFDPFFTTKSQGKGTGLGLASVYGTITTNGGFIKVDSSPGKGTKMIIYIPQAEQVRSEDELESCDNSILSKKLQVLFVDDEENMCAVGSALLASLGHSPVTFRSSVDALAHYRKNYDIYDVVIVDLIMPELDGVDFLKAMSQVNPDARVIISTGVANHPSISDLKKSQLQFLFKPYGKKELQQALNNLLFP